MTEVRCTSCKRKLAELEGKAVIKCPRCKTMNEFNTNKSVKERLL